MNEFDHDAGVQFIYHPWDRDGNDGCGEFACDIVTNTLLNGTAIDFCLTSLFSWSLMCTNCGIELCKQCHSDWLTGRSQNMVGWRSKYRLR